MAALLGEKLVAQEPVEPFGLRLVARETIENKAFIAVRILQPSTQHVVNKLIGDQLAAVHKGAGGLAECGAAGNVIAQQVAGRDLRDAIARRQDLSLRAFAGPGGAQQDNGADVADGGSSVRQDGGGGLGIHGVMATRRGGL